MPWGWDVFGSLLKSAGALCFLSALGGCVFQSPKMNEAIQSCPAFESAGWQLLAAAPEDAAQMIVVAEAELLLQQTDKAMDFYWFSGEKGRILLCRYFKADKGFEGLENCGSSSGQFERAAGGWRLVPGSARIVVCG